MRDKDKGWAVSQDQGDRQEKLFPSSLHHGHLGAVAIKTASVFLALKGRKYHLQVLGGQCGAERSSIDPWALYNSTAGVKGHRIRVYVCVPVSVYLFLYLCVMTYVFFLHFYTTIPLIPRNYMS